MEMEISCYTVLTQGSKNCFCLQGIFAGNVSSIWNVINAFYNKFWNGFGEFFKRPGFFAFGIWTKGKLYIFNLLFFSD